jgi:hypothetical protein
VVCRVRVSSAVPSADRREAGFEGSAVDTADVEVDALLLVHIVREGPVDALSRRDLVEEDERARCGHVANELEVRQTPLEGL